MSSPHATQTEITLKDIEAAHTRIEGAVYRTPVLVSEALNNRTNANLFFKAEVLQKTGAFKARGAMNFLLQLDASQYPGGVVAYSSGNHAQAVAYAATKLGVTSTIVMPADAPTIKIKNTQALGGKVVLYNRLTESREDIARSISEKEQAALVPPFDHPWTIGGQGTVALELLEQVDTPLDILLVPCSGGGLTSGCGIVFKSKSPQTQVWAVEPEGYDDVGLSLKNGSIQTVPQSQPSLCDSLMMTHPGTLTFPILQNTVQEALVVPESFVRQAMADAFEDLKVVVEPGGAIGLGAVLAYPKRFEGKTVGIILSGGNVDAGVFSRILSGVVVGSE